MPDKFSVYVMGLLARFEARYGNEVYCFLEHSDAFSLLVATMLSAQCTDARVNMVTPALFKRYPDAEAFAGAKQSELEEMIHSTGFFRNKAANIIACADMITKNYAGKVPDSIDGLTALPGVGRKTANVILTHIYHIPSVVVDTHVLRVSGRLGLTNGKDPVAVEQDLMRVVPNHYWSHINFWFIKLGRAICAARRPKCNDCFLTDVCGSSFSQGCSKQCNDTK